MWTVKYIDNDLDDAQVVKFKSEDEAKTWLKSIQSQERYDPTGFEVVEGPVEIDDNKMLTEGKHWPEDYEKTAFNAIKSSALGRASWYTDNYIKQDVRTFIDEFTPLSHKNSNLGFFMAIVRWFIEYSGDSKDRYQEFIERKLDGIIAALLKIRADKAYDTKSDEIKKMSFEQFEKLMDEVNSKSSDNDIAVSSGAKYNVVPIYSYEELNKRYGGKWTGYKGKSEWCHTNGKSTYDSWTNNGTQMFFVIEADNWKSVKAPQKKPDTCYDAYGMSLIAILIDVQTNKLLNSTSRWNHVVLPASGAADTMFESWQQLNKAVGLDVESICKRECAELAKKNEYAKDHANDAVNEILNSGITSIENDTIPEKFRNLVTTVVISDNVTSIGAEAFSYCTNLTSIVIPNSVTSIGAEAFSYCTNLTSIVIPNSVTSIGAYAFSGCSRLTSVTIPNSVTSIGNYAFYGCSSLTSVTIPNSVTSIGNWAFHYCTSLKSVTIPDSIVSIGDYAFYNCTSLTTVTIPDSVTSIGESAFAWCSSLTSVTFKGKTLEQVKVMDNYPWGIKDTSIIKCEDNSMNEQLETVFESCNAVFDRCPASSYEFQSNDFVSPGEFAYDNVKNSLREGMSLCGVWTADDGSCFIASICGENGCNSLSRATDILLLQEIDQMLTQMLQNGCGSVQLLHFDSDTSQGIWHLVIGFDLLTSPFADDQ